MKLPRMETAKNVQRSRSLFGRFKVEGKGYSPDIFSELQREPTQLTKFGAKFYRRALF